MANPARIVQTLSAQFGGKLYRIVSSDRGVLCLSPRKVSFQNQAAKIYSV